MKNNMNRISVFMTIYLLCCGISLTYASINNFTRRYGPNSFIYKAPLYFLNNSSKCQRSACCSTRTKNDKCDIEHLTHAPVSHRRRSRDMRHEIAENKRELRKQEQEKKLTLEMERLERRKELIRKEA